MLQARPWQAIRSAGGAQMAKSVAAMKKSNTRKIQLGVGFTLLVSLLVFVAASASGESWSPVGEGMDSDVYALMFDNDGNLYAGGAFTSAGGIVANHAAVWNGLAWSELGGGLNSEVYAFAMDNLGNLYAGGNFTSAGGTPANHIAKWDGARWTPLGDGLNADVYAVAVSVNGEVYAGGTFSAAGDLPANRIARWDGSSWSEVGEGMNGRINALLFDNAGNLLAGGSFTTPAARIARWDGSSWLALGSGVSNTVRSLALDDYGDVYVGGSFIIASGGSASRVAKWDGTAWYPLTSGTDGDVYALAVADNGDLFAAGNFEMAGGWFINRIAKWDGSTWSPLESGISDVVRALAMDRDGSLFAGGLFTSAGTVAANHIAGWSSTRPQPSPTALPPNSISPITDNTLICSGEDTIVSIHLASIANLYGYQFIVHYDPLAAAASGAFTNTFFDTRSNAVVPPGWNGACTAGECKFAASKVDPGLAVSGSGNVAQIRLVGVAPGAFNLTISEDVLSDRDSLNISHTVYALHMTVCGYATVSGTVSLQGRSKPLTSGQITLTDLGGVFGPYTANFSPSSGNFSIPNVRVMAGGSNYLVEAVHGVYLGNRTSQKLQALDIISLPETRLLGGDANNDGLIDLSDLTCIGGAFGSAPVTCGTDGSSDVNADGRVNIQDLVLPSGNYGRVFPGDW